MFKVPDDEQETIKPAVNGVLNVFKACIQPGSLVKRVVLTSSIAAIAGDEFITGKIYSENDFADPEISQPYTKSKILSEKAAWNFVKENDNFFELAVINPGKILILVSYKFINKIILFQYSSRIITYS